MLLMMMRCTFETGVLLLFSGVMLAALTSARLNMADFSPRECLRFYRDVMRQAIRYAAKKRTCER